MSGVGKSTIGVALRSRGFKAVDLDCGYCNPDGSWNETLVERLISTEDAEILFVIGAADNQPRFYPRFDLIVLLSAPVEVMIKRLSDRTTNPFGKHPTELAKVLSDHQEYEPLIRRIADAEIVTDRHTDAVLEELLVLVRT
jgi:shikimate kinase